MSEEPEKPITKAAVEKQLLEMKAEHVHHIMRALGMLHPDLTVVEAQHKLIERIDVALSYLQYYPKGGYGLDKEDAKSPKVWAWMTRFVPKLVRAPAPAAPAEEG